MLFDKTNTPDEVIDHVNEHDQIIGTTTKGVANSNPKVFHREVSIILYDEDNRILFQQRSRKKIVGPLEWSVSCEGHIPSGISIEDGAQRELQEELNLSIPLKFIKKEFLQFSNESHFTYWFVGKYDGEEITIEPEEVEQVRLLSQEEMEHMIEEGAQFSSHSLTMVKKFWNNEFHTIL